MARLFSTGAQFDANAVQPAQPRELVPNGKYLMQIIANEDKPTSKGDGRFVELTLEILDGDLKGRKLWDRLNLENPSQQAVEIAERTLSAICHATGKMAPGDADELMFIPMMVTVKIRPAGKDKSGVDRQAQNEIGGYEPVTGPAPVYQPAQQQRPAPAAYQRPAQPSPAAPAVPAAQAPRVGGGAPWRQGAAAR